MTATSTEAQDLQDMENLAAGRDACLDLLMQRHATRLFHYLLRILRDETEAEDVAQEAFVKVYQNRVRFDSRHRFQTWLYAIATNLARDRLRRRRRRPELSVGDAEAMDVDGRGDVHEQSASGLNPRDGLMAREAGQLVRRAIQSLPEDLRIPLVLSEYDELSHADIGQVLGCTPKAVEMRLYRARQSLRSMLAPLLAS